jgi:hypothetical protein
MADTEQQGPVITEDSPTRTTTETTITSTESKPAIVSTVADVQAAIQPFVQRLETIEALFANSKIVERLEDIEKLVPAIEETRQAIGSGSFWDRLVRLEQLIIRHFGAHQLSTAEPKS